MIDCMHAVDTADTGTQCSRVASSVLCFALHPPSSSTSPLPSIGRAQMERRAYGAVDFATHLRMAAVSSKLKLHPESLRHCRASLAVLQQTASEEQEGSGEVQAAFNAHLAVAYHNTAVQLAHMQQLHEASVAAKLAHKLAATSLPPKHRWFHTISSTARLLKDMHISTTFVTQQVRQQDSPVSPPHS